MNINFNGFIGPFFTNKFPCLVLLLMFAATACTKQIPRDDLPALLTNETFGERVKVVTVPLPVIATSPNEGLTLGALSAFLLHNKNDEVSALIAPQLNYNENFGASGSLYGAPSFRNPIGAGKSTCPVLIG